MNKISCDLCMDLIPLVHDGVASRDSMQAVQDHIRLCPHCRLLFDGELPVPPNPQKTLLQLQNKLRLFSAMLLMFGMFWGLTLTAKDSLFYNTLIMPAVGFVGYHLFHIKALYWVPALLLATHLATNALGFGGEYLDLSAVFLWTGLYCLFAGIGFAVAALLAFAFKKEDTQS